MRKSKSMKAVRVERFGGYDELRVTEVAQPVPEAGEVLVKVTAAAVNHLDDVVRSGKLPGARKPPFVLGHEGAGVVVESGSAEFLVGDRVIIFGSGSFGLSRDGTWQEYLKAGPGDLVPLPDGIADAEAASVSASYLTAQLALRDVGGFEAGQSVLIPGVSGAVGNAALQLAREQGATRLITTATTTAKAEWGKAQGFAHIVNLSEEPLHEGIARLSDGGIDLVVDAVGGGILGQALASLKSGGTLVSLGLAGGRQANIDLVDLLNKAARIVGFKLISQTPAAKASAYKVVLRLLAEKRIKPAIARTFSLAEAAEAQRFLVEESPTGKVVLTA